MCSMSMEEEEEVVFDLPEDVIVKILLRLPVKSQLRFTCVSKQWQSIISDSKFARSSFEVASHTATLRPRLLISAYPYSLWGDPRVLRVSSIFECLGDLDVSSSEEDRMVQSLTPPEGLGNERVMTSCNGLVVLGKSSCTNLCVWNPTTGFFCRIPDPEVLLRNGTSINDVAFAFGHVMATDDYKFVFFVPADFAVHIFSTREGSWKVIKFPHSSFPDYDDRKDLLVSNGAVHWVSTGIPEAITAFDLVSEEFCQLPLPSGLIESVRNEEDWMDEFVINERNIWTQVLVGGRLCVRSWNEYWVMKEYGVPESWVKMFQFSVIDIPDVFASVYVWEPVFVTEGGTVVMLNCMKLVRMECHREGKPECSGWFNIKMGRIKIEDSVDGFITNWTLYDETLLSI